MLNHIVMMGRLTKDPELRQAGDTPVCTFRIACDRDYKNKAGEKETDFVDVVVWRKMGENVAKYFTKGKPILIEGRLRQDSWEDKQTGQKRTKLMVVLERFEFVGSARDNGSGGSYDVEYSAPQPRGGASRPVQQRQQDELEDDDVPF